MSDSNWLRPDGSHVLLDEEAPPDLSIDGVASRMLTIARRALFREHASEAERDAAERSPDAADELERICIERSIVAEAARKVAEQEGRDRQARLRRYYNLHEHGFPLRLIEEAVGNAKSEGWSVGNDVVPAAPWDTAALLAARRYIAGDKVALVLLGGVGAGKSLAATWTAFHAPAIANSKGDAKPVGYVRSTTLERDGRYDKERRTWLDKLGLLVIDDLGVEPLDSKGYYRALLEEIVDDYLGSKRRLVITSNLLPATIVERYGDRVWSRLHQCAVVVSCGSVDLRREGKN